MKVQAKLCLILNSIIVLLNAKIEHVHSFKIPLPGGKSISYNQETGVLRIQLDKRTSCYKVPPIGTKISPDLINSIKVKHTGIPQKGYGAFATKEIRSNTFLGFYEGQVIKSREKLDEIVKGRMETNNSNYEGIESIGAMDYVMSIDGGMTFLDGFER